MKTVTYRYSAGKKLTWMDQQEADCCRYDDEHGLTVTEVFIDVGLSRHGLHQMLDAAEREDVTGLIVTDLARLGSAPSMPITPPSSSSSTTTESISTSSKNAPRPPATDFLTEHTLVRDRR